MDYKKRKEVLQTLGITYPTLYKMAEREEIDAIKIGGHQYYNLNKYLKEKNINKEGKKKICYCRVSSQKQKEDLGRQIESMKQRYPEHEIIADIGSGLNYKRKGLQTILDRAISGDVEEVVIAYKDRLTRFGYEMIEYIIEKYSRGKIVIGTKMKKRHHKRR